MRSFLTLSVLSLVFLFPYSLNAATLAKSCSTACASPFGKKLGGSNGVIGYSNCNNECESEEWHKLIIGQQAYKTGMKWQCVEYARRWYIQRLGYTFASIDHAYEIWDLETANKVDSNLSVKWHKFTNGKTREKPRVNDLLIYNKKQGVHGHVSVVVKLSKGYIYVAEQNYANTTWENESYARKILLQRNPQGHYLLKDLGVIGWMRLA
ncbi:CHAP domain-containing protein [Legionella sp. km772]|uniref:CHAP domain-containing protein n=1 Tax=Legionella sp. km772 TaxID=2498111 RepID=UPI000F8D86EA|nr:CHAP domain-containing protein [Legionella sp. km772]RUR05548.1 CHAP domain-containing protein [Legionella sp. km772]